MDKIAADLKKRSINLKSLEENKISKNCWMQEPEEIFKKKMYSIHNIFWDLSLS